MRHAEQRGAYWSAHSTSRTSRASRYGLILFLDVLEHMVDPGEALRHARSLLAPGGTIFVTVPAFKALWTAHDDWNHHQRRYTRSSLLALLTGADLTPRESFYFFQWLAPVKFAVRLAESLRSVPPGPATIPPRPINEALFHLSRLEARTMTALRLPFGSSVCAVATA